MTNPSLALTDSPELPAEEIGKGFREALRKAIRFGGYQSQLNCDAVDQAITSFYVTLGKHLLTAEEARWLLEWASYYRFENETLFGKNDTALGKLRHLSGSSRGEE